jgi:hypothetical protein
MASVSEQFRQVECPQSVRRIEPSALRGSHKLDYGRHPAYANFSSEASVAEKARALSAFARNFLPLLVKRAIRYEMIPYDVRQQGGSRFAIAAARNLLRLDRKVNSGAANSELYAQLKENGVGVVAIPQPRFDTLETAASGHFDDLVQRRGNAGNKSRSFEEARSSASRLTEAELYLTIERLFQEAGVMSAASAYLGRTVKLIDVNPQINDTSDAFWRDVFPDIEGRTLPRTAYYHRDASGGDLKAIIYMSDVPRAENGAFSYVLGSNRASATGLDDLICEANDHGLSATDPQSRRLFAALPKKLRQKGAFGNDLPDDSPQAKLITDSSWAITSSKGAIVLFDTKGVHRGGMVESGERRVITCVLG